MHNFDVYLTLFSAHSVHLPFSNNVHLSCQLTTQTRDKSFLTSRHISAVKRVFLHNMYTGMSSRWMEDAKLWMKVIPSHPSDCSERCPCVEFSTWSLPAYQTETGLSPLSSRYYKHTSITLTWLNIRYNQYYNKTLETVAEVDVLSEFTLSVCIYLHQLYQFTYISVRASDALTVIQTTSVIATKHVLVISVGRHQHTGLLNSYSDIRRKNKQKN